MKSRKKIFHDSSIIVEENIVMIRDPKTFCFNFDFRKDVDKNLKREIGCVIKINESLVENKIRNNIEQLLLKYKHGNNIHEHKNSKPNEPHKFVLNLSQRLDISS